MADAVISAMRAEYLNPLTSGLRREQIRFNLVLDKYIHENEDGSEDYHWPAGLDLKGIADPTYKEQWDLFGHYPPGGSFELKLHTISGAHAFARAGHADPDPGSSRLLANRKK